MTQCLWKQCERSEFEDGSSFSGLEQSENRNIGCKASDGRDRRHEPEASDSCQFHNYAKTCEGSGVFNDDEVDT